MFRVADRQGKTVYQLSNEMSFKELMEWGVYYDRIENNRVSKQDLYLARIAYVCSGNSKAKLKDFIVKFKSQENQSKKGKALSGKDMSVLFKAALGIKG